MRQVQGLWVRVNTPDSCLSFDSGRVEPAQHRMDTWNYFLKDRIAHHCSRTPSIALPSQEVSDGGQGWLELKNSSRARWQDIQDRENCQDVGGHNWEIQNHFIGNQQLRTPPKPMTKTVVDEGGDDHIH